MTSSYLSSLHIPDSWWHWPPRHTFPTLRLSNSEVKLYLPIVYMVWFMSSDSVTGKTEGLPPPLYRSNIHLLKGLRVVIRERMRTEIIELGEPNFNRAKLILFILLLSFTCFPIVIRSSASDFCSMTEISGAPLVPFPPPLPLPPFFITAFTRELGCSSLLGCMNGYVLWLAFRSWNRKCFIGSQRINMKCRP